MKTIAFAIALLAALIAGPGAAQTPSNLRVTPAVDGVFDAFQSRPVVALGEAHGLAQMGALYFALVRDPRFADQVGNLVVEAGGAAHQDVIDRYVSGQDVPYTELRKVWTETVGWVPVIGYQMNLGLFAAVREANKGLPPEKRIKVWLGEPSVDWSKIQTHEQWLALLPGRDPHAAGVIDREILAKGKKALVIYGSGHFIAARAGKPPTLRTLIETGHPKSVFVIFPFTGFADPACSAKLEARLAGTAAPVLLTSKDGAPTEASHRLGCLRPQYPPDSPPEAQEEAVLYLGPLASLTRSPGDLTLALDQAYFDEISRRNQIQTGRPYDWSRGVESFGRGPQPFVP
jgi:hypothetical protein